MQLTAIAIPAPLPQHIEITPGVCGGKPRIAGTRIRVQDVMVWHERMNLSADEIASTYPHVSLAAVYAALTYYYDHRLEIDEQIRRGEELVEQARHKHPSKLSGKLQPPE